MSLWTNILLIASLFLSLSLSLRISKCLNRTGMTSLFAITVFFSIWVGGNLIELNVADFQWMLWGRNIQQIGVFFTPLCTLFFSVDYTGNRRLRKFAWAIAVVQALSVLLIFTDQAHHLMRLSVGVQTDAVFGQSFVVHSSRLGSVLVAFNFCVPLLSIGNLMLFTRKVSAQLRRPLWLIIISILVTFLLAFMQSTLLTPAGINIPIPVWNLPCLVLFSYVVLREGFVGVAPTALNKVFEVIDQGIVVVDERGGVIEFNRRAGELTASMNAALALRVGVDVRDCLPRGAGDGQAGFTPECLPEELKNPRHQVVALACHALEARRGKRIGFVLVLTDITLLKIRAEVDYLTGSYNREGLANAFLDLQKSSEAIPYFSALILDLDNFKAINDTYGHLGGDVILCDFAGIAKSFLSETRFLGRLGGDEFVIILPAAYDEAAALAEALRTRIAQRVVPYLDYQIRYTVSIGIASCKNEECVLSELLHQADRALYEAKHHGKNAVRGNVPQEDGLDP